MMVLFKFPMILCAPAITTCLLKVLELNKLINAARNTVGLNILFLNKEMDLASEANVGQALTESTLHVCDE